MIFPYRVLKNRCIVDDHALTRFSFGSFVSYHTDLHAKRKYFKEMSHCRFSRSRRFIKLHVCLEVREKVSNRYLLCLMIFL